ncbi:MAG: alpha-D-ribose 1-methylphosphonate 5-triphosphate diphosphatase [Gemmobacter sp.]|nr:alpha-D-ribose 1-methylphosphonate 5-triphosphate diphosphatase [Gemmobacter sp.]
MATGLATTDREAAAHGVTTAWLAQGWSWEGGHRSPDTAEALMAALADYRPRALTDLRLQIRAETHFTEAEDRLIAAVERHAIDYVVFNDHLEEGYRMSRSQPADFAYWARKLRIATEDLQSRMDAARSRARAVPRHLCRLAETFDRLGVSYGSHDDPNGETREFYNMIGARIAEFPLTRAAAAAAHAMGNPVLMGAPNVVRGGSQSGNIAAADLISEGLCDVLVSDYHIPALPLAAFALADRGVLPLARAWEMISTRPAAVMGLADRGYIAPGLRADLVILHAETRAIEATISGGRLSHLSGEAGHRFLSQSRSTATSHLPLAAE